MATANDSTCDPEADDPGRERPDDRQAGTTRFDPAFGVGDPSERG